MKKFLAVSLLAMTVVLASCGAKDINTAELASKLATEGEFAETLTEVSADITQKRYGIAEGDIIECAAYSGTRAVVDEVVVFKANDVEAVKEKVDEHIASQTESYTSYRPDEVPKLEDSLVMVSGDYVIVCVSEDSSVAEDIVAEYTK